MSSKGLIRIISAIFNKINTFIAEIKGKMKKEPEIDKMCQRYPDLAGLRSTLDNAARMIIDCYMRNGILLICGNGGSSSDAEHTVAELMKGFEIRRPLDRSFKERLARIAGKRGGYLAEKLEHGLPAVSLSAHTALTTAISNDTDPDLIFAQQIIGYGSEKDILIAISTSGNSRNILDACIAARAINMKVIGITCKTGGKMKTLCDILVNVPAVDTADVQELQRPVLHTICRIIENHFYGKNK